MKLERIVWLFFTAILLFWLFKSCHKDSPIGQVVIQTIKTVDTLYSKRDTMYKPSPVTVIYDTIRYRDTVFKNGETVYIEKPDYQFSKEQRAIRLYNDTLRFDTSGYAVVKDSVKGEILKRAFNYKIFAQTVTITKTVQQKKSNKLFAGLEYTYPINYLGGAVLFQSKSENIIKLNLGLVGNKPVYGAGYYTKIKLR